MKTLAATRNNNFNFFSDAIHASHFLLPLPSLHRNPSICSDKQECIAIIPHKPGVDQNRVGCRGLWMVSLPRAYWHGTCIVGVVITVCIFRTTTTKPLWFVLVVMEQLMGPREWSIYRLRHSDLPGLCIMCEDTRRISARQFSERSTLRPPGL